MKTLLKKTSFAILAALVLASCDTKIKKDDINPNNLSQYKDEVEKFFRQNAVDSQQFTINATTGQTIVGSEGTIIEIPANAFEDANGNPVTGNVTVNVKEIFDQSDMVFSGVTTQSNGQILVSGGEIFIGATVNGQQVFLDENATIDVQVQIDGSMDPNMDLFVGNIDTSGTVNWLPADTSNFTVRTDSLQQNFYYAFSSNTLGWLNCDYFYNKPNTDMAVILPSLDDFGKEVKMSSCFVVYKDINSVVQLYNTVNCQATSCPVASFGGKAGINEPVIVLTVADIGGKLHYSKQEVTITANHTITLTTSDFTEVTEAQLQSVIDAF